MAQTLIKMAGAEDFLGDPEDLEEILREVNIPEDQNEPEEKPCEKPRSEKRKVSKKKPKSEEKSIIDPKSIQGISSSGSLYEALQEVLKRKGINYGQIIDYTGNRQRQNDENPSYPNSSYIIEKDEGLKKYYK